MFIPLLIDLGCRPNGQLISYSNDFPLIFLFYFLHGTRNEVFGYCYDLVKLKTPSLIQVVYVDQSNKTVI